MPLAAAHGAEVTSPPAEQTPSAAHVPGATPTPAPTPTPTPTRPPIGFATGRYEVLRFLGEGGRKRVYLARDTRLHREVAVAVVKLEGLDDSGIARAHREADAMARLGDHPNVVTIHDIGEDQGQLYVVSQFMAGGDLSAALRQAGGQMPLDEAIRIGGEISRALEYAHGIGIIHRDIKPANVWLAPDGTAKLGDFGLAVDLGRSRVTAEGSMMGTVAYMAPEIGLGMPADVRSDIYSLGALLYELLCGAPPFAGDDLVVVISQHVNTPPVAPSVHRSDIPPALEQLVLRMLAKAPEGRPQTAGEVSRALEAISTATTGTISDEDAAALDSLAEARFVGREPEIRDLRSALDAAVSGRGRIVTITGEAGVGKSRLAAEVATYAKLRGAQALVGRALEDEGAPVYWPWIQVIRGYIQDRDGTALHAVMGMGATHIATVVPEVRSILPDLPEPPTLEPEQARFRLFDAVTGLLANASRIKPLIVVLEDLNWADKPSLMLLQFVARSVPDMRILLVGTVRDEDLEGDHAMAELLAELGRARGSSRVRLRGLSYDEAKEMIEAIAGQRLDSPDERALVRAVQEESKGNPYFVEEIIRHLRESGTVYRRGGRWVSGAKRVEDLGIPAGIREIISQRLARLSTDCRRTLALAAAIGREFPSKILESVAGQRTEAVSRALDEALAAEMIHSDEGGRYIFEHPVMREILYGELDANERLDLHDRIGTALEAFYDDDLESHLGEIARHLAAGAEAGDPGKAMDFAWWAGEHAAALHAYDDAAKHFERALALFERTPDEEPRRRCELLIALGDARWRAGETEAARKAHRQAADLARKLQFADAYARAALGYGGGPGGLEVSDKPDSTLVGMLQTALDLLPARDTALRVRVMSRLAVELYLSDDIAERESLASEAVAMAERIGEPRIELLALYSRAWARMGPDEIDAQAQMAAEIVARARALQDLDMEFRGHHFRLNALLQLGDIPGVEAEIAACKRIADESRQPYYLWQAEAFAAMQALMEARFEEGERLAEHALALGQHGHAESATVVFGAHQFFVHWGRGTLGELAEGAEGLAANYPRSAWPAGLALVYAEGGERDKAARSIARLARDGFASIRRDANFLTALCCLSMACQDLDDERSAGPLYELLAPYAERCTSVLTGSGFMGSNHDYLGLLCCIQGRWSEAVEHFERGLEIDGSTGARVLEPRIRLAYARALLANGSERQEALRQLERGLEVARSCNMPAYVERLLKLRLELLGLERGAQTSIEEVARSVEIARPDLRPALAPDGTVTIMFSDIENSTALTERLGDSVWIELLHSHNRIVADSVRRHGGFEVKNQGDGFMLAFSSARRGINCAIEIERALLAHRSDHPDEPLHVRIGMHTGEAVREGEDFFGKNVILAARIAAQAAGDQILVSSLIRELVASSGEFAFDEPHEIELKGLAGKHTVYPVLWDGATPDEQPLAAEASAGTPPSPESSGISR
jgi:class 3 adenylate cyclase